MTEEEFINNQLQALSKSKFRSGFKLKEKEKEYIKEKYNNLEKIAQEDLPYISLYRNKNIVVYSSNLLGEITPNNYTCYYNIETWYRQ